MNNHFVATGYVVRGEKTLLLFHKKLKMWLPPGGHIDAHETPERALLREIREETGLEVEIIAERRTPDPAGGKVRYLYRPSHLQLEQVGDHKHIDLIYFCRVISGEPIFSPAEHDQMKWFSLQDLQGPEIADEVRESATLAIKELGFGIRDPAPSTAPSRSSGTMGASERRVEFRVPAGAPGGPSVLVPSLGRKAIVLLSGGLDSATALFWAISQGFSCQALSICYGQRHSCELDFARELVKKAGVLHQEVSVKLPWLGVSSLVDSAQGLPDVSLERIGREGIPSTYVPGRNTIFVSLAVSLADAVQAQAIVLGANILDYSGYPDCRPEFYEALQSAARLGTKSGDQIELLTPLIQMTKAQIIRLGLELKVPFELTWSCYAGGKTPCGRCDSCKLRAKGFEDAGLTDPLDVRREMLNVIKP
ncbi:MAG: 7-cyano-7-deazaguanine synthase QueC [Elusimicrobia bacterium]|nr:7-cyano-7-deazaguanine synthase QueC [Elusimicrobiota bacterium]